MLVVGRFPFVLLLMLVSFGCASGVVSTKTDCTGESDGGYQRIFGEKKPETLVVLNSSYTSYRSEWWAIGNVFSNLSLDWEVEVLAPVPWIESRKKDLALADFNESTHLKKYFSPWFTPDEKNFELWKKTDTSIPYMHMFVDRRCVGDNIIHAFIRKD